MRPCGSSDHGLPAEAHSALGFRFATPASSGHEPGLRVGQRGDRGRGLGYQSSGFLVPHDLADLAENGPGLLVGNAGSGQQSDPEAEDHVGRIRRAGRRARTVRFGRGLPMGDGRWEMGNGGTAHAVRWQCAGIVCGTARRGFPTLQRTLPILFAPRTEVRDLPFSGWMRKASVGFFEEFSQHPTHCTLLGPRSRPHKPARLAHV